MRRFVVERDFARGLDVPGDDAGRRACASVIAVNAVFGVTWIHTYVSADLRKTWCIYEAPSEDEIRRSSERNGLPVTRITEVWRLPSEGLPI